MVKTISLQIKGKLVYYRAIEVLHPPNHHFILVSENYILLMTYELIINQIQLIYHVYLIVLICYRLKAMK